ncbi:DUF2855 family protein [Thalassotalea euphylliae]|uniref:DUF2855 family protein n=1 Tax=Thalassotalea euphylliae TaxID=1655234 RepID=A0A3E0TQH0_9GAMM|nr:DUF2855 family protein [Thalassotalea euphylliae]REL26891.1 DUF2855 family protein [Thalassotalea euphylliae]
MSNHQVAIQESVVLEVCKQDLAKTRVVSVPSTNLANGEVRLKVDQFALTANNITYAITGDMLGYWQFFPADQDPATWGRIPVMAFAQVIESRCDDIEVGERVFGFFPMTQFLTIKAGHITPFSFSDTAEHRHKLSSVYANYERVAKNPFYRKETQAYQLLIKGLYTTSWLIDDFMSDHNFFGASQYIITSASSKTSMALAFASRQRDNAKKLKLIGLTSPSRVAFVKSTKLYDEVFSYEDIATLDSGKASIFVDMAGSKTVLTSAHQHFAENIVYSCSVGATHINDLAAAQPSNEALPGAKPETFFAPTQIKVKSKTKGGAQLTAEIAQSMNLFIEEMAQHIKVKTITSIDELNQRYLSLLSGQADASAGLVFKFKGSGQDGVYELST